MPGTRCLSLLLAFICALLVGGCASAPRPKLDPAAYAPVAGEPQRGLATWYGESYRGRPTASGERFDPDDYTAAHRTLAFGVVVEVKNLRNGRRVLVRINDRGPFAAGRVIDLSEAAARELGMVKAGVVPVEIRRLRRR